MRLATRSTLVALSAFVPLLVGFAFWTEYQLRSLSTALMEGTARLLGTEIASVVSETVADQLLQADPDAQGRLNQIVADLSTNSEVVAALTVVDATGKVVASKDLEAGRQLAPAEVIFTDKRRSHFLPGETPLDDGGRYHLFVPLLKDDALIGYLRLSLSSHRLIGLYRRARQQFIWLAVAGLACVAALGLALEVQFSRMSRALAQAFESATRGAKVSARPYRQGFSEAIDAARRAGEEIGVARSQTADAQKRFGELMKVMDVGVALVSSDYGLDFANESAREVLGCVQPGELEQRWPDVQEHLSRSAANLAPEGGTTDLDIGDDDQRTHARLELYPREDRGGWLILVKNRDKLDALENELRLAIQMRGFAHFYMAFAHDLKAPLNAMVLNLELLKRSLPASDGSDGSDEQHTRRSKYIQTLVGEVSRLDRFLRTVLTHAAPPSTGIKEFDGRELIEELGSLLGPQARHQRVNLGVEPGPEPLTLNGHRDRLKQALLNLAINALESMPQGGELTIQAAKRDTQAAIAIRDTGPGIPPELLKDIYKMHFTTKDGGTGIGLYVARSVIQAHGGDIQVESEAGRGTCFRVTMPLFA